MSRCCFDFSSKLLISFKVRISVGILNVNYQRMFLAHLQIVLCHLVLVMLVFSTFNLILICILRVFVEIRLSLAIDPDFEQFARI